MRPNLADEACFCEPRGERLARGYLHRLVHDLKIQSEETSPAGYVEQQTIPKIVM
jgi:hypothetical protein